MTFLAGLSSPAYAVALDLRFHQRYLYWSIPGKSNYIGDGGLFRLALGDAPYDGISHATRRRLKPDDTPEIEDLTLRVAQSLRENRQQHGVGGVRKKKVPVGTTY